MLSSTQQLAARGEIGKSLIGFLDELHQCTNNADALKRAGLIKDYLKLQIVICLRLSHVSTARDYYLILHRVPPHFGKMKPPIYNGSADIQPAYVGRCLEADSMLPIGYRGESTNNVIASGVTLTSGVWLLPLEWLPDFGRQPSRQKSFEVGVGILRPRIVDVSLRSFSYGGAGRVSHLVERVFDMEDSFSSPLPYGFGDWHRKDKFDFIESNIRIELNNSSAIARSEERIVGCMQIKECFTRPFECLSRMVEC